MDKVFEITSSWRDNFMLYIPSGPFLKIKTEEEMNPTIIILCGIPTSGKSTWAKKNCTVSGRFEQDDFRAYKILSRDEVRLEIYGPGYKQNSESEKSVTIRFDRTLHIHKQNRRNIILDNTHCRDSYIKDLLNYFAGTGYQIKIKFFDIPLWKAYYRNIKRRLMTGKWVPFEVIKAMKTNYDKIDKTKYEQFI